LEVVEGRLLGLVGGLFCLEVVVVGWFCMGVCWVCLVVIVVGGVAHIFLDICPHGLRYFHKSQN
jgi:hypothetical protein